MMSALFVSGLIGIMRFKLAKLRSVREGCGCKEDKSSVRLVL